ncbi:PLP-dependent transferase [Dacryopinax primogenitus]|uniref:PLP-dependent transferase n=1 Tax=Dacryopinax primogenitus (strain DJM 731) TaxID=1858805 RepID=M5FV91_DACPD|nr:PLP-dependent transferase [Dacryopinax primogenitus]EJT99534.1 PLP-dependent transferase [Dacryopinax primogenitus]
MTVIKVSNGQSSAPNLSHRGRAALSHAGQLIQLAQSLFQDGYSSSNPGGYCNLGVAENSLQHQELLDYYNSKFRLEDVDFTYGNDLSGSMRLSAALARLFNGYFHPVSPILPDHLLAGAGCSALVDMLVFHIGDPGQGVLIPVPYYTGFNGDFMGRSSIMPVPVPVDQADPFGEGTLKVFEATLRKAEEGGIKICAVMLCHPHNPLGQCYPRETVLAYARFCEAHNLHLISDEIYALSVFPTNDVPEPTPFVSVLSIDWAREGVDPARIHVIYGMSKDFNANGLRGGVLCSQHNSELLVAVRTTSMFMKMSSATVMLWSAILEDPVYLPAFIKENQRRLREAYEYVTRWFQFHQIPYLPSNAGHFAMANFRQFFPNEDEHGHALTPVVEDNGVARDAHMFRRILGAKVFVGSAMAFSHPTPGWVRLTFAVRRDYLVVGLERLERVFGLPRWPGLDEPVRGREKEQVTQLG